MVPLAFITMLPAAGEGAAPGARLAFVPMTAATLLVVSLTMTLAVVPPVAATLKLSSTALITGSTGVWIVLVQRALAGHVASPPPVTVAVFVNPGAATGAVGVTGITKLVLAPAARPAATVHVTVWPAAVQPAGSVPIVRPVGIVSLTVTAVVVAAVPVLDTCSV